MNPTFREFQDLKTMRAIAETHNFEKKKESLSYLNEKSSFRPGIGGHLRNSPHYALSSFSDLEPPEDLFF